MSVLDDIKKIILRLLDEDETVRAKLKEVVNDTDAARDNKLASPRPNRTSEHMKPAVSAAELAEAKKKLETALKQKEGAERLCGELQQELQNQQEAYKRERDEWETERSKLQKAQKATQDEASQWEQKYTQKETDLQEALSEKEKLQAKQEQAKKDLKKAQDKIAEQEATLEARFPRGWELFKQYPRLSAATREELTRVFVNEEVFASFICCGAQSNNLEDLWEIIEKCWERKASGDLRILQEFFVYCIELVNRSHRRKMYAMLDAKSGDEYDNRIHTLETSSKKQGKIHQVCVQGFYNPNTRKIVKKSLVNLE